jgi:hypothetical protein
MVNLRQRGPSNAPHLLPSVAIKRGDVTISLTFGGYHHIPSSQQSSFYSFFLSGLE